MNKDNQVIKEHQSNCPISKLPRGKTYADSDCKCHQEIKKGCCTYCALSTGRCGFNPMMGVCECHQDSQPMPKRCKPHQSFFCEQRECQPTWSDWRKELMNEFPWLKLQIEGSVTTDLPEQEKIAKVMSYLMKWEGEKLINFIAKLEQQVIEREQKRIVEMVKTTKNPYMVAVTEKRFLEDINKIKDK